ncbi:MAG TPA: glycosyltransferase family 4 protein [bacterium]|nr:glycosyltransferase family 4 protein [bacterium]
MAAKIFIAADIFPPDIGGPATYAASLARALLVRGYEVRVLCYGKSGQQKIQKWPFMVNFVSKRWPMPVRYFLYFIKLLFLSRSFPVIYAQGPVTAGLSGWLVKKITGKRLVVKVVGDYAWEQARMLKKSEQGIDDWQIKPQYYATRFFDKIKLRLWAERKVTYEADKVVVPSHYLKKIVTGWGVASEKIEVIYNTVSFTATSQEPTKAEAKQKIGVSGDIIFSAGRFTPWKGFDFLIRLMPELLKINPNFKFIIAGEGIELENYQKTIRELGLLEKVFLPGVLDKKQMGDYFRAADIFLLNSGYEGLAHAVLEAMKYHVPVIVSDMGGNSEIVDNEINGLLVPYNDQDGWLEAIVRLWRDKKLYQLFAATKMPDLPCFNYDEIMVALLKVLIP